MSYRRLFVALAGALVFLASAVAADAGKWGPYGGYHPYYPRYPYYRPYYRPYYGGYYGGGGVAAGLLGGLIVGGLIIESTRPRYYGPAPRVRLTGAHYTWCGRRYKSFRAYDNSWQPYHGPRRPCISPYM
jgi:hypothetical protein